MTPLPSFDLTGQVALVTGASSGIGRHLALLLAAAGAKVALAARRTDRLAEAAREIEADGGNCLPIALDVTRADSVAAAVAAAEQALGPLSLLVNNAGVVVSKPVLEHTEEDWDYVVDTDLKGAWLMAREFASHLVERRAARSDRQHRLGPGIAHHRAGAELLRGQGRADPPDPCAGDGAGAPRHPGQRAGARAMSRPTSTREFLASEAGKKLAARIPLRRVGQPDDLDGAMLLLASPAGAYITGAVIAVDGGHAVAAI